MRGPPQGCPMPPRRSTIQTDFLVPKPRPSPPRPRQEPGRLGGRRRPRERGTDPPASTPAAPWLCRPPAPHFHMTPAPWSPPTSSALEPLSYPPHPLHTPSLPSLCPVPAPTVHRSGPVPPSGPGAHLPESFPPRTSPHLTTGLGPLLSPRGPCRRTPRSPKPGGTAGVLRVPCYAKQDQPGKGIRGLPGRGGWRPFPPGPHGAHLARRPLPAGPLPEASSIEGSGAWAGWQGQDAPPLYCRWRTGGPVGEGPRGPRTVPRATSSGPPPSLSPPVYEQELTARSCSPGLTQPRPPAKATEGGQRNLASGVPARGPETSAASCPSRPGASAVTPSSDPVSCQRKARSWGPADRKDLNGRSSVCL